MWEIREKKDSPYFRKGMRGYKSEADEAYEHGYKEGFREAMKEAKHYFSERSSSFDRDED